MKLTGALKDAIADLKKIGITVSLEDQGDSILLGPIRFEKRADPGAFEFQNRNEGVFLKQTSEHLRRSLRARKINYIDVHGNLNLEWGGRQIHIEAVAKKNHPKIKSSRTELSPTNLVSPNGLAAIDMLFRLEDQRLEQFRSVLSFCNEYHLDRPKLSSIMTKSGAKGLVDFKRKLRSISFEWWQFALESAITRRKMTSFFSVVQEYHSLDSAINSLSSDKLSERIEVKFQRESTPGPTEVAKKFGHILDNDFGVWVSTDALPRFKKEFKLVPGAREGHRRFWIAAPKGTLKREELITHEPGSRRSIKTNLMRAIWDLGFGDLRMKEARDIMLRKLLHET